MPDRDASLPVPRRVIARSEWLDIAQQIYTTPQDIVFRCVACGHTQSCASVRRRQPDADPEDVLRWIYMACEGRHVPGVGCDWTLGGLFRLHTVVVTDVDGQPTPAFEFADASVLGAAYFAERSPLPARPGPG